MATNASLPHTLKGECERLRREEAAFDVELDTIEREIAALNRRREDVLWKRGKVKAQRRTIDRARPREHSTSTPDQAGTASAPISIEDETAVAPESAAPAVSPAVSKASQPKWPMPCTKYPTIVRMPDGKMYAISCFVRDCRANASTNKGGTFFRGVLGLFSHVGRAHRSDGNFTVQDVADKCNKEELDEDDVALIERGKAPRSTKIHEVYPLVEANKEPEPRQYGDHAVYGPINENFTQVMNVDGVWVEL